MPNFWTNKFALTPYKSADANFFVKMHQQIYRNSVINSTLELETWSVLLAKYYIDMDAFKK